MVKLYNIINENPTWFSVERLLFKPRFLQKFCVDIQGWALENIERDSMQNLENQQLRRIQKLIRHAYASVPYWTNLLNKADIQPKDINSIRDFQKIPYTSKVKFKIIPIKERISSSIKPSRHYPFTTSGSTGTPTPIVLDTWIQERIIATRQRGIRWILGPQCAKNRYIRISPRNTFYSDYEVFKVPDLKYIDLIKEKLFDICKKNNCVIFTNPSIIFYLTQLVQINKKTLSLKGISLGGEDILSSTKEYITKIFQCPVMGRYTCSEVQTLASTCKYDNYHTNPDQHYVEVIDDDKNIPVYGKVGRIVVTDFNNYAMPFIRYEIGDMGIIYPNHQCKCGSLFPVIEFIGRDTTMIKLPNEESHLIWKILSPLAATKKRPWILQFQMVRKSVYEFEILMVTTNEETQSDLASIKEEMQQKLGIDAIIKITRVSKISAVGGTKLHSYISLIKTDEEGENNLGGIYN